MKFQPYVEEQAHKASRNIINQTGEYAAQCGKENKRVADARRDREKAVGTVALNKLKAITGVMQDLTNRNI